MVLLELVRPVLFQLVNLNPILIFHVKNGKYLKYVTHISK